MARQHAIHYVSPGYMPEIRMLQTNRPWAWLKAGWHDLSQHPIVAVGYGLLIAVAYALVVGLSLGAGLFDIALNLTAAFVLIAPLVAIGFYTVSQRIEQGAPVRFADVFRAWRVNPKGTLGMGAILVLLFLSWFMVAMALAAFMAESRAEVLAAAEGVFTLAPAAVTDLSVPFVLAYLLSGLVAALVVFAFAAFSMPALMEHEEMDPITALVASWKAVIANWRPMLLWAVLIAVITGIGLMVAYIGLAVTMPLLGFATWHAYRETLGEWREVEVRQAQYY